MTRKISSAVLVISAILATACGSAELAPCQVLPSVQGGYVVHFTLNGTAAGCPAEFSDLWAFNNDYPAPIQGEHGGLRIDYRSMTMPFPEVLPGPPNGLYGYGDWDAEYTDDNASCTIPSMDAIQGATNALDGTTTTTVTYAPTALTYLSGSEFQGAEFKGTVAVTSGACSGTYSVQALSPAVGCSANEDCDPFSTPFGSGLFPPFDQACFLATTHSWLAAATAFLESDGVCFVKSEYPSIGGWKGADQALP